MKIFKTNRKNFSLFPYHPKANFFNFFDKKNTYVDPEQKMIRKAQISKFLIGSLVALSWVVIFKIWWGAEEICKKQFEALNKEDASVYRTVLENKEKKPLDIPEEFRPEYVYFSEK